MKNKKILLISFLASLTLGGCKLNIQHLSTEGAEKTSQSTSEISSSIITNDSSSRIDADYDLVKINEVREKTNVGEVVVIRGVVVKHNYTGQTTPYITGFWIADDSGSIYIYGENSAKSVKEGNTVIVKGKKVFIFHLMIQVLLLL